MYKSSEIPWTYKKVHRNLAVGTYIFEAAALFDSITKDKNIDLWALISNIMPKYASRKTKQKSIR